jgi:predicted transcriptional regulator
MLTSKELKLLLVIMNGEKTITTLSKEMNLSIYRTSTLTGKLAKKGLITITKNGKLQVYPNLKIMDCR